MGVGAWGGWVCLMQSGSAWVVLVVVGQGGTVGVVGDERRQGGRAARACAWKAPGEAPFTPPNPLRALPLTLMNLIPTPM